MSDSAAHPTTDNATDRGGSRSPSPRRGSRGQRRSRSRSFGRRSPSPRGRGRRSSPPSRRRYSRSYSRSRSRSPRGDRDSRDRPRDPYFDRNWRGGPQPGPYGRPPDDGWRGDFDRRDRFRDGPRDLYGNGDGPPHHHPPHPYGRPPQYRDFGGGGGPPHPYPPMRGGGGGGGRPRRRDAGPPGVSLLVRNVSTDITVQDLEMAFGRIGDVRDVYIPKDFHSNQRKGFAFVEYATPEMAREAKNEMDRFVIKGAALEVVFAQERRKTPNEMRGRVVDGQEEERGRGGGGHRDGRRGPYDRPPGDRPMDERGGEDGRPSWDPYFGEDRGSARRNGND